MDLNGYEPKQFADLADTKRGRDLWAFLNHHDNVIRMETATDLTRPAVEPLSTLLIDKFGDWIREDRTKQMVGHMARQVMEAKGCQLDVQGVKVRFGDLFSRASRYRRS